MLNLHLDVMITDGSQPIGNGIGPVLEARDVMRVLRNDPAAPADLREKSLRLAGRVIEFDPDVRGGDGWRIARDILESGRALAQMEAIIDAQGRRRRIARAGRADARGEGAECEVRSAPSTTCAWPASPAWPVRRRSAAPGWTCCARSATPVHAGQALYRIHARYPADLGFARDLALSDSGYLLNWTGQHVR